MAYISSHFLNGTNGTHASAVGVKLIYIDAQGIRNKLFEAQSDDGGRFSHDFCAASNGKYEIVIASGIYFERQALPRTGVQILSEIVIRFTITNPDARCHIPVIMSPNSYSCWWSN